jgi:hypothetical protein
MTNSDNPSHHDPRQTKDSGKSFNFSFSLGKKAPADDPAFEELLDEAKQNAAASPEGVGPASRPLASLEFSDGVLRVGGTQGKAFELDLNPDTEPIDYRDPFPALTALRNWFHRAVMAVSIALPVALIVLGIATDQTFETTFYMALFGLFLSLMLVSTFMPQRTWLDEMMQGILSDAVRRQRRDSHEAQLLQESLVPAPAEPESALPAADVAKPIFEIKCQSCGARFTPAPPRAVCPHCSTAALPD